MRSATRDSLPGRTPLAGKVVLVTGAAQGIGLGVSEVLAADGATVVLCDRDGTRLREAVAQLRGTGYDATGLTGDVSLPADVSRTVEAAVADCGRIDGLVNNAGIVKVARFADHTLADWQALTSVNLMGTFLFTQAVMAHLGRQESGSIVNVSSIAALGYTTSHAAYAATKAGLLAMTRELAVELAPQHVRVNAVLPGFIRTTLSDSVSRANGDLDASSSAREPVRDRWGHPRDVGHLVSFLMADRSSYITGAAITVAGGSDLAIGPLAPA